MGQGERVNTLDHLEKYILDCCEAPNVIYFKHWCEHTG